MNIKRLGLWFYLLCKRQLKNMALTFFLLAMPVSALIVRGIPAMEAGGVPQVALFAEDEDALSQKVMETLLSKDEGVAFYKSPSLSRLREDIIEGRAACAYVFRKNLEASLDRRRLENCILLIKNGEELVTGVTNEIVISALIQNYARSLTLNFMKEKGLLADKRASGLSEGDLTQYFDRQFNRRLSNGSSLRLQFETLEKSHGAFVTQAIETKAMSFPFRGVMAVLIYTACISGAIQWLSDRESSLFAPMERGFVRISRPLYILVPALFFSVSGLSSLYLGGTGADFFKELLTMLLYILLNVAFGSIVTLAFRKSRTLTALLPVMILGSLLLCPVFLDLRPYLPIAGVLNKLFLPYYYLRFF